MVKYSISLKDIAQKLEVSEMTVSRALNGKPGVSEEKKRLILEEVKKVGYRKNSLAATLKRSKSFTLGVVIHSLSSNYYSELFDGIQNYAKARGYRVLLGCPEEDLDLEIDIIEAFLRRRVDGLLVAPISADKNTEYFSNLVKSNIPIVFIDRHLLTFPQIDYVTADNIGGGFLATEYLILSGHKKIGFIQGSEPFCCEVIDRYKGYKKALEKYRIDREYVISYPEPIKNQEENGYLSVISFFKNNPCLTALFAVNDNVAIGAIKALKELGFIVPEDVSIVGFDDISIAKFVNPSLTTIFQNKKEIGERGTEMLIDRISNTSKEWGRRILIPPKLIIRESVRRMNETSEIYQNTYISSNIPF
jgi:LacI family transcriptional regulator